MVRNVFTGEIITSIDKIIMVALDDDGKPKPHGYSTVTFNRDRVPHRLASRCAHDAPAITATMDRDVFGEL